MAGEANTVTVQHPEHGELEVELPAGYIAEETVSEKYVPKGAHDAQMAKMRNQMKTLVDPDDVLEDEEFRERALTTWGIDPEGGEGMTDEQVQQRIQAMRQELERKQVQPLQGEVETLQEEVETLRRDKLTSQLVSAASGVVDPALLKSPVSGQAPPIVNMLASYFAYDPETGTWAVREGEGFRYSGDPDSDRPYMGPEEFLGKWVEDPANEKFVVDDRQRGPGHEDDRGGGGGGDRKPGGVVTISYEEAQDAQKYRAAREEAKERGTEVKIIGSPWESE